MTLDDEHAAVQIKEQRGRLLLKASVVVLVVFLVVIGLAGLFYLVGVASKLTTVQAQVADCTTPGGVCYQRGQQQTSDAVNQIITALDTLEAQRGQTSAKILASEAKIRVALQQLCSAQGITCSSLEGK